MPLISAKILPVIMAPYSVCIVKTGARFINVVEWIVSAVREHISCIKIFSYDSIAIRIDESADARIVVTALEVIESGLSTWVSPGTA